MTLKELKRKDILKASEDACNEFCKLEKNIRIEKFAKFANSEVFAEKVSNLIIDVVKNNDKPEDVNTEELFRNLVAYTRIYLDLLVTIKGKKDE